MGVEIKLAPEGGWALEYARLLALVSDQPFVAGIVFLGIIIILIFIPGGVGPAWVKYRGAKGQLEKRQSADVEDTVEKFSKRAQRRLRGKGKGGRR